MSGDQTERRKINDPASPYYLSSSDYPGQNICGLVLTGESNYKEWATSMKNAFRAKRKLVFLDGTIKRPETNARDLEDWLTVHSMAVGWIMTLVDQALRTNLVYTETVCELWNDLEQRFAAGDAMRTYELKELIRDCRQDGQTITTYFGRLKGLWDDYDDYWKFPQCTCGACTCNLNKLLLKYVETEKIHDFLMGLDHKVYKNLRSNILSLDDLPSLTRVYKLVTQEERLQNLTRGKEEKTEAMAFATRTTSNLDEKEGKIKCTFCHKTGHEAENCFRRTGNYPDWWYENPGRGRGERSRGGPSRGGHGRGRSGRGGGRSGVHAMHVGEYRDGEPVMHEKKNVVMHKPEFTDEQWQTLMKLMEKSKNNSSEEKLTGPTYEDADWSG
ncbi:unnamed protein product [Cuscuta epithymum]|uniref:Retrotransposon Copia-like N-terminal domain-containing protein n=1 Tax=Cuscuta epithymum TaxID=186058 RepID=A0AAV0FB51_9ASTE|nr:unnamed protein product [Cuscuta epithymum]